MCADRCGENAVIKSDHRQLDASALLIQQLFVQPCTPSQEGDSDSFTLCARVRCSVTLIEREFKMKNGDKVPKVELSTSGSEFTKRRQTLGQKMGVQNARP